MNLFVSHSLVSFCFRVICFVNVLSTFGPLSPPCACCLFGCHICIDNQAETLADNDFISMHLLAWCNFTLPPEFLLHLS